MSTLPHEKTISEIATAFLRIKLTLKGMVYIYLKSLYSVWLDVFDLSDMVWRDPRCQ